MEHPNSEPNVIPAVVEIEVEEPTDEQRLAVYAIYRGMGEDPIPKLERLAAKHQVDEHGNGNVLEADREQNGASA